MNGKCETRAISDGRPCGRTAAWQVRVGTRNADAQLSCNRHLSLTCRMMRICEGRDRVTLTVTLLADIPGQAP